LANLPVWRDEAPPKPVSEWTIKAVIETGRLEEPIGNDERVIDASQTSATIVRNLTFTKDWSRTLTIESEKAKTISMGGSLNMGGALNIGGLTVQSSVEEAVRDKYGVSATDRETHTEEMSISVPGGTRQRIVLQWKRLWQKGIVRLLDVSGNQVDVPFGIAVGVTFDQTVVDEPA
jgi:hypothetical protein